MATETKEAYDQSDAEAYADDFAKKAVKKQPDPPEE